MNSLKLTRIGSTPAPLQSDGLTVIELMITIVVGSVFFLGLLSLGQTFGVSAIRKNTLSNYIILKNFISYELMTMDTTNCSQYIQAGPTPFPSTINSPINVSIMRPTRPTTTTPASSPSPVPSSQTWVKADGSTIINGSVHTVSFNITNNYCFTDFSGSCQATLTLKMTPLNPSRGSLNNISDQIANIFFQIDPTTRKLTQCFMQQPAYPGEVKYDAASCRYPPGVPNAPAIPGGPSEQKGCPLGQVLLGACQGNSSAYCTHGPSNAYIELGCCPLRGGPSQIVSSRWIRPSAASRPFPYSCDMSMGEVVTGLCNDDQNGANCGGQNQGLMMRCSQIKDSRGKQLQYQVPSCHYWSNWLGSMNNCEFGEIMTGYCPPNSPAPCPLAWDSSAKGAILCCAIQPQQEVNN